MSLVVAVNYGGEDPRDYARDYAAAWCVACGEFNDLAPRGEVFLCREHR